MGKKKQLTIKLITVPNGYTLDMTMDGISQGYMYFTLNKLLEGFMYHVGLKEIGVINKDEINIFLTAITKWQDNKQLIVEKIQNEAEIAQLKERVCQLSEQGKEKTERLAELRSLNKKLKNTNKELTEKVESYEKENGKRPQRQINNPNII